jgi:hypothetical protein
MEYSRTAREVVAPNGQRFIVDWAAPRHVEKAFGAGRWGVEVMQGQGPFGMVVVEVQKVESESEGEAAIRALVSAIRAGRWEPPRGSVRGGRSVRELPLWAVPPVAFVVAFGGIVADGGEVASAAVIAAVLAVLAAALTWFRWLRR